MENNQRILILMATHVSAYLIVIITLSGDVISSTDLESQGYFLYQLKMQIKMF